MNLLYPTPKTKSIFKLLFVFIFGTFITFSAINAVQAAVILIKAEKTVIIDEDLDGNGVASPGDILKYTVTITNNGDADATGVLFTDTLDPNSTYVADSLTYSPIAVPDVFPQTVLGNVRVDSSRIPFSVLTNDNFGSPAINEITLDSPTSAQGGDVTMVTSGPNMGQFTYDPPPGYEGTDTFTYTLTNATGSTTATVSLTVSKMIWFVNNNAASCTTLANGCGRLSKPFSSFASLAAINNATGNNPTNNDIIFVYESNTNYSGAISLLDGQKLIGQDAGASLATLASVTPGSSSDSLPVMNPATPYTTLASTVTLNNNTTLRGLRLNTNGVSSITDPATTISNVSVSEVSVNSSGGTAIQFSNIAGTINFNNITSINGQNGIVLENFSTGTFTVPLGTITNSSSDAIKLNNAHNVTLSNFTVTNAAANATNPACNFTSISTACEAGVEIINSGQISLDHFTINQNNFGMQGIVGQNTSNLTIKNTQISNVGESDNESGMLLNNLSGAVLLEDLTINNPEEFGIRIYQTTNSFSGTLRRVKIQNNNGTFGEDGLSIRVEGGTSTLLVDDSDFLNTGGSGVAASVQGAAAVLNLTVQNSTWSENYQLPSAVSFITSGTGVGNVSILNNTISGCTNPINCFGVIDLDASDSSSLQATITGNTITNSGQGTGIEFMVNDLANGKALIANNNLTMQPDRVGMNFMARSVLTQSSTGRLDLTLTANTINGISSNPVNVYPGMNFQSGSSSGTHAQTLCVNLASPAGGNIINGSNTFAYILRQRTGTTFQLQGFPGSGTNELNVENFVQSNNPVGTLAGITDVFPPGGSTIVNYTSGTCQTPALAPVPASTVEGLIQSGSDDKSNEQEEVQDFNNLPDLFGDSIESESFSNTKASVASQIPDVTLGVLPPGASVVIEFKVTINNPLSPVNTPELVNQGVVSGSNFTTVLTDDPALPGLADPTVILLPKPDLTATKTNDVSGSVTLPDPWNWNIRVENKGNYQANFKSGDTILLDNLPNIGLTYTNLTVSPIAMGTLVGCSITNDTLTCLASSDMTIAASEYIDVSFDVTPSGAGAYNNPISSGYCVVDPYTTQVELDSTNNNCSDSVSVNNAPTITSADFADFIYNTSNTFTITTTPGFPTGTVISIAGTLPNGVTFTDLGNGSGTISGTPTESGSFNLTIKAANSALLEDSQSFTLNVNQAPVFTSANSTSFTTGVAGSFTITTESYPVSTISFSSEPELPASLMLVDNGDGTATLSGTPLAGDSGLYTISLTAKNGITPDGSQTLTLSISLLPTITSADTATFTAGSNGSFTVTTSGYPTASISYTGSLPSGVSLIDNLDGTATLSGTPAAGSGGKYSILLTASNGLIPNGTQNFNLTVQEAPNFTSANSTTFTSGVTGSFTITTVGYPTAAITFDSNPVLPASVTLVDNGDGTATLSGTPLVGDGGQYQISLVGSNGVNPIGTQTLTLTIGGSPVITSTNTSTFVVGTAGSFTITTSGFPFPAITYTGTIPTGVSLVDNLDGTATLSGTPANGSGGQYLLTITVTNIYPPTADQLFTLVVNEAPKFTNADKTSFEVNVPGEFTIITNGYPTPAITFTSVPDLPASVSLVDNGDGTATLSGTPSSGDGGVYAISLTADNDIDPNAAQTFTLTIGESPVITSADKVSFVEGNAGSFTVTSSGTPTATLSFTGTLPSGVSFMDQGNGTALLAGTPTSGTANAYPLTIKASNINGESSQSFTLTIQAVAGVAKVNSIEDSGDGVLDEKEHTNVAITQLLVTFNQKMDPQSAINLQNYYLMKDGNPISIESIFYNTTDQTTALRINGGNALSDGEYQLTVYGGILDTLGYPMGENFIRIFFVDTEPIIVEPFGFTLEDGTILFEGIKLTHSIKTLHVSFNEDAGNPAGYDEPDDVTNPENYLLVQAGPNNNFDTTSCETGLAIDDVQIPVGPVVYDNNNGDGPFVSKLTLNNGKAIPNGYYRLFVCGSTSIVDLAGNKLNNDIDQSISFRVQVLKAIESLPSTGFIPGIFTELAIQPSEKAYQALGDLWLELPTQGIKAAITGVPWIANDWDLTWLNQQVGWLEGTAFPTWNGNTVLTAHAYRSNGLPGPFAYLKNLRYGDKIVIHYQGLIYTYAVRSSTIVSPKNTSLLSKSEKNDWLTLITCQQFDDKTKSYLYRTVVRAVLIQIDEES